MRKEILLILLIFPLELMAQKLPHQYYWNSNTQLTPWRLPIPLDPEKIQQLDLDNDGDPDVIKSFINDSIPILWIDDDDDMKSTDFEGDIDNDCLLVDSNNDGIFAGPYDLSVDWGDEDNDGIADIQLVAQNSGTDKRNFFDWNASFMYIIDLEKDNIKHFIDWNSIKLMAWNHSGQSNFFEDYHGNTLFLKMHASTFRINDMRYSWENPFIFYDTDNDGLSEWTIRLVDKPHFRPKDGKSEEFDKVSKEIDAIYTKKINYVGISWDLDNDNAPGNEFDYDMSLRFTGVGFDYSDQVHKFKSLRGLPEANKFFFDPRWRQMDELVYADRDVAWDKVFKNGDWNDCRFVFDEDDDCNRWERVEFYDNKSPFKIGSEKGGIDNDPQADELGDRAEWDTDFSGKGNLYISPFDGRIHLYGAELGYWRVDQTAYSYQGFGGLYDRWKGRRIQQTQNKFATVKYSDTNNNGFLDEIDYDLDGDTIYETKVKLIDLHIDDKTSIINTGLMNYENFNQLFTKVADNIWIRAQEAVEVAKSQGLNPNWYSFWMQPRSIWQKYEYGYWLNFYLYQDLRQVASSKKDESQIRLIDIAYYSGNWSLLLTKN